MAKYSHFIKSAFCQFWRESWRRTGRPRCACRSCGMFNLQHWLVPFVWYFYVSCSQNLWKTCPVMAEKLDDSEFTCYYPGCGRSFNHYKNLLRHYQLEKLHKSTENLQKRPLSAKQAAVEFLPELPAVRRRARVKEIVKCLIADELHNLILPHLIGVISPWQILLKKVSRTSVAVGLPQAILNELDILKQTACQAFPVIVPFLYQAPHPSSVHLPVTCVNTDDKQNFMSICMRN